MNILNWGRKPSLLPCELLANALASQPEGDNHIGWSTDIWKMSEASRYLWDERTSFHTYIQAEEYVLNFVSKYVGVVIESLTPTQRTALMWAVCDMVKYDKKRLRSSSATVFNRIGAAHILPTGGVVGFLKNTFSKSAKPTAEELTHMLDELSMTYLNSQLLDLRHAAYLSWRSTADATLAAKFPDVVASRRLWGM